MIASGLSFLETASNPFIAKLGSSNSSERRLNFSQAFNPLGSICGVLIGTIFILSGIEMNPAQIHALQSAHTYSRYLQMETLRVVRPYLALGAIALIWAFAILRTQFPGLSETNESTISMRAGFSALRHHPHTLFAVVAQFLYVGAQVGTWSYFIQYIQNNTHLPEKHAGYLLTGTLAAFAIGRFFSAYLMRFFRPARLMALYGAINVALLLFGILRPGWAGMWCIFMTSFFMSVMYPTIFALGIRGLGANTKLGGSIIVMAIVGGAVLTPAMGLISQFAKNISTAYWLPAACYLAVAAFAFFDDKYLKCQTG